MVGPIGVKKPRPLPLDLLEFINDAGEHGFIIVSFGSYVEKIVPKEKIDMMAAAFAKLKQKVLWRHKSNFKSFLQTALSPCKGLFSESKNFNLARNKWQRIKKNNPLELLCPRQSRRVDRVKVLHVIPTESSNEKRSFDSDYLYLRCEDRLWDKLRMTFS